MRGPNVMAGYISPNDPAGVEPLADGWHDTGDVVDIDDDGFVTILGRVKRFAKIGGEMVSLTAVEGPGRRRLARPAATPSSPCPTRKKGERLVLVTDYQGAETARLSEWARDNGAPELAVPKKIVKIAAIPVLGTGKTDYVAIQKLVEDTLKAG